MTGNDGGPRVIKADPWLPAREEETWQGSQERWHLRGENNHPGSWLAGQILGHTGSSPEDAGIAAAVLFVFFLIVLFWAHWGKVYVWGLGCPRRQDSLQKGRHLLLTTGRMGAAIRGNVE